MSASASLSFAQSAYEKIQNLIGDTSVGSQLQYQDLDDWSNSRLQDYSFSAPIHAEDLAKQTRYDHNEMAMDNDAIEQSGVLTSLSIYDAESRALGRSDEEIFHDILKSHIGAMGLRHAANATVFANITKSFAEVTNNQHLSTSTAARADNFMREEHYHEKRAERDFWSLLSSLAGADVLGDINELQSQAFLQAELEKLPVIATLPDYINVAYSSDQRLKKGRVLQEWLENSVQDTITNIPAPIMPPWSDTLYALLHESTRDNRWDGHSTATAVTSLHPDAQLSRQGALHPLMGHDRMDQERLLRYIWQLIRSGQLSKAQEVAAEHQVFWLAASMRGLESHYYHSDGQTSQIDQSNFPPVIRVGNTLQPVWTRTCWKYADFLAANQANFNNASTTRTVAYVDRPLSGVFEMTIHAALANNVNVLSKSPLISSWHDRLWIYIKAVHCRDIDFVLKQYRANKMAHSSYYPGCDYETVQAEDEIVRKLDTLLGNMSSTTCTDILRKVSVPTSKTSESILIQLQAAFMQGFSGVASYMIEKGQKLVDKEDYYAGISSITRILCHTLIWSRFSPVNSSSSPISSIASDDLFFSVIEAYIQQLISTRQYHLVALYCLFLNKHRRVNSYASLLLSIQKSNCGEFDGVESKRAMSLAEEYFPDDIVEITRVVVQGSAQFHSASVEEKSVSSAAEPSSHSHAHHTKAFHLPQLSFSKRHILEEKSTAVTTANFGLEGDKALLSLDSREGKGGLGLGFGLAATAISEKDKMAMESLRWLMIEKEHSHEALRQANRLISQLLLDSKFVKIGLVDVVLSDYVAKEIQVFGDDLLDTLVRDGDGDSLLESRKQRWRVDRHLLNIWKHLTSLFADYERWKAATQKYQTQRARSIGNISTLQSSLIAHASDIFKLCTRLTLEIESLLIISSEHDNSVSGISAIFSAALASSKLSAVALLEKLFASIQDNKSRSISSQESSVDDPLLLNEIKKKIEEMKSVLNTHAHVSAGFQQGGSIRVSQEPLESLDFLDALSRFSDMLVVTHSLGSKLIADVHAAVSEISLFLQDFIKQWSMRSQLLFLLLQTYTQVCLDSSSVLGELGQDEDRYQILSKVIKLSEAVASDDPSLRLYAYLDYQQLQTIIQDIGIAAFRSLQSKNN